MSTNNQGQATNGLAVTGLVTGIVGLPLMFACGSGGILSILAIIFGALGIKKANAGATGKGMAKAGLILGIVGVAWFFIVVFALGLASIPGSSS